MDKDSALKLFRRTESTEAHFFQIYCALLQISPSESPVTGALDPETVSAFKAIGNHILETITQVPSKQAVQDSPEFYTIFGKGGDHYESWIQAVAAAAKGEVKHTVNISTITTAMCAALLFEEELKEISENPSSHKVFPDINKLGTGGVTGAFGSTDTGKRVYYPGNSSYYGLDELGRPYSSDLKTARKMIHLTANVLGHNSDFAPLDAYKASFTDLKLLEKAFGGEKRETHAVTGVANLRYVPMLEEIIKENKRSCIIVHSSTEGIDEVMAGENIVLHYTNGERTKEEIFSIGNPNDPEYRAFIREKDSKNLQFEAAVDIFEGKCPSSVLEVMSYNMASLMYPFYHKRDGYKTVEELGGDLFDELQKRALDRSNGLFYPYSSIDAQHVSKENMSDIKILEALVTARRLQINQGR